MSSKKRDELYELFATGNKPNHDDFVDLIDSAINVVDDGIGTEIGMPMEIIAKGEKNRFLDLSSDKDTPLWRISAESEQNSKNGFSLSSNNSSRIFIKKDNGNTGINSDDPQAKLHIAPDGGEDAIRIDNETGMPSVIVNSDGNVGIGTDASDTSALKVTGGAVITDDLTVEGVLNAKNGIDVNNSILNANKGLSVHNGAVIESGALEVKDGVVVSTGVLEVNDGAVVSGGSLEAKHGMVVSGAELKAENGLIVNNGVSVESGMLEAKDGAIVSGAALKAKNGLEVEVGMLEAKQGAVVSGSELIAENGMVVRNSVLSAENGATVSGAELRAESGVVVSGAELQALSGMTVSGSELYVENGAVFRGSAIVAERGAVVRGEELTAENGVTVRGAEIRAENGVSVSGAELTAENGARIRGAELAVENGARISGAELTVEKGAVLQGLLRAEDGATISGAALKVESGLVAENGAIINNELLVNNGATVNGTLNAPDLVQLGDATVESLTVNQKLSAQILDLQTLELVNLNASNVNVDSLTTNESMDIEGEFSTGDSVVLGGGKLCVTFKGDPGVVPKIHIIKGVVSNGKGHFDIEISEDKQFTIIYDDFSTIDNFDSDWSAYKLSEPLKSEGFEIEQSGSGEWKIRDEVISFSSTGFSFKECAISENGLRFLYTGSGSGIPGLVIEEHDDEYLLNFDFLINELDLTIKCPKRQENRTVENLLSDWAVWRKKNEEKSLDFEIQQLRDQNWKIDDILNPLELVSTGTVVREFKSGAICIEHSGESDLAPPIVKINSAVSGSDSGVNVYAFPDSITIDLGIDENSPHAIFNAWKEFKESGSECFGFDVEDTSDTNPLAIVQEEDLDFINETYSEKIYNNYYVYFNGPNAGTAKVRMEMGSSGFEVIPNSDTMLLTIFYPENVPDRTISNLMEAWADVTEKKGFEIKDSSSPELPNFQVVQQENMDNIIAEIKVHNTTTAGVDGLNVYYKGPESDQPTMTIKSGEPGEKDFDINVDQTNKTIQIVYPEDKTGTVDKLMSHWLTLDEAETDGFIIEKQDISKAAVFETSGNLVPNSEGHAFSKGIIRTNRVTLNGDLKFSDSNIVIGSISNSDSLHENSHSVLPTQKSVKSYVDGFVELLDAEKADKSVVETALGLKADKAATEAALNLKADNQAVTDALALKADDQAVTDALALKADSQTVTDSMTLKADNQAVTDALALKADSQTVTDALALKADSQTVTDALALKADDQAVTEALALKANAQAVTDALALKANDQAVTDALALKADDQAVTEALALKADDQAVTDALVLKADSLAMTTALSRKADLETLSDVSVGVSAAGIISDLGLTSGSRGMLMVLVKEDPGGESLGTGLFAIHGTSMVSKISGNLFSDTQGGSTYNIYYDEGVLTIENTSVTKAIVVDLTYFGA
ncbi:MAG: hypothetical protein GY714_02430 [Desulfobacterales bacterium]|nr:hypothetical protein [Desulfobacterales bacterium]